MRTNILRDKDNPKNPSNCQFFFKQIFIFGCSGSWLWHSGSVVAMDRLIYPMTFGILVLQTATYPVSSALEGGFLTIGSPEKS